MSEKLDMTEVPVDQVCASLLVANSDGITWAHYPYRYVLKEVNYDGLAQRSIRGFELAKISAQRTDTELHNYSRYFIIQDRGLQGAFHFELPRAEDMTERQKEGFRSSVEFEIVNHLGVPSAEDHLVVEYCLKLAMLDGFEPYLPDITSS